MNTINLISIDIGAGTGRIIKTAYDGQKLRSREMFRFENHLVRLQDTLYWDFLNIMHQIKKGIASMDFGVRRDIHCIGVNTWGADYGMLDRNGGLLANPVSYRDPRTEKVKQKVFDTISKQELDRINSSATMDHCTLFQLYYTACYQPEMLEAAEAILPIPNLINYFLCGMQAADATILSGSQFFHVKKQQYVTEILDIFHIPQNILPKIRKPGIVLGKMKTSWVQECNLGQRPAVALVASHDSASAVTGIPLNDSNDCFMISGTWSVIGMETRRPINSEQAYAQGFTNWCAFRDRYMFVKIFSGFYFLQEMKKIWDHQAGKVSDYTALYRGIAVTDQPKLLVNLTEGMLLDSTISMEQKLHNYFRQTGQPMDLDQKEWMVGLLYSMVLEYWLAFGELEMLTQKKFLKIWMVGGGSLNTVFCQRVADCLKTEVHTGYPESTVNGNVAAQLLALGEISSLDQGRDIIKQSSMAQIYTPRGEKSNWETIIDKYLNLKQEETK